MIDSQTLRPVVGARAHTYDAIHDWGELPGHIRYGNTHGVQVASNGDIYILHTVHASSESDHAVVVFSPEGEFKTSWGGAFAGGAHGLLLRQEDADEFLYICDVRRNIVQKTTLDGEVVLTLGYPSESPAYQADAHKRCAFWKPTNAAVASSGDIYIADGYGSSFVVVYDRNGVYKTTFGGGRCDGVGQLNCPHGIWIDNRSGREEVLVADRKNHRLQYFDLVGEHLRFVDQVDLPCHLDVFRDGTLLVPDLARRVTLFDAQNRLLAQLGEGPDDWMERRELGREHFPPRQFVCPHSACFDHEGNIFVVEWVEVGRVTKLVRRM